MRVGDLNIFIFHVYNILWYTKSGLNLEWSKYCWHALHCLFTHYNKNLIIFTLLKEYYFMTSMWTLNQQVVMVPGLDLTMPTTEIAFSL